MGQVPNHVTIVSDPVQQHAHTVGVVADNQPPMVHVILYMVAAHRVEAVAELDAIIAVTLGNEIAQIATAQEKRGNDPHIIRIHFTP